MWETIGKWIGQTTPSSDQVGGVARALISAAVGFAVGKQWIPAEYANELITGIVGLMVLIWTMKTNSQKSMVASVAGKGNIVVTPDPILANAIPDEKVVAASDVRLSRVTNESIVQSQWPTYRPDGSLGAKP